MRAASIALHALARALDAPPPAADLGALHARLVGEVVSSFAAALAARRGLPTLPITLWIAGPAELPIAAEARRAALAPMRAAAEAIAVGDPHAVERLGAAYEATTATALATAPEGAGLIVVPADRRRRGGSHYTAPELAARIVEVALAPLVAAGAERGSLRVVDPAMGSGACLLAALRWLTSGVVGDAGARAARRAVASRAIAGLDIDAEAARVAIASVWLEVADPDVDPAAVAPGLRVADGLVDTEERGADAFVGNPPWVSFVGRAAQPLDPATRARFGAVFTAFAGYRNLQGLFLEHASELVRPGGRVAFLVPSSMAEQQGYAPTRRALDRHCAIDQQLVDVGEDAFEGVFQPCMILSATRRAIGPAATPHAPSTAAWPVERPDLDDEDRALLARLAALPPLPPHMFGERGVQTSGDDVADMARERDARRTMPLRAGGDIEAFLRRPPGRFADPTRFPPRFRGGAWGEVAVVVRQTAPFPIAAQSDGLPFRNSLLAAFAGADASRELLVAWLNASPIRWHHHMRFRDARQGMPQVKVAHLRAVPAPVDRAAVAALEAIGARLSLGNEGIDDAAQAALDAVAADALALGAGERTLIERWRERWRTRHRGRAARTSHQKARPGAR